MAFRFDFQPGPVSRKANLDRDQGEKELSCAAESRPAPGNVLHVEEVSWDSEEQTAPDLGSVQLTPDLSVRKGLISSVEAASLLKNGDITASDLLPGRYEGGFKLWECALDLARYLWESAGPKAMETKLQGQRVIELGCGHGIPGIVALLAGAAVDFQDYNKEVLSKLTCHNVAANCPTLSTLQQADAAPASPGASTQPPITTKSAALSGNAHDSGGNSASCTRFYAGDWVAMPSFLSAEGLAGAYDLVLTAETIYSQDSLRALHDCIFACLRMPHGKALVAAKLHYFGIELGGGVASFTDLANELGKFSVQIVAEYDDGASNCRQILQLAFAEA